MSIYFKEYPFFSVLQLDNTTKQQRTKYLYGSCLAPGNLNFLLSSQSFKVLQTFLLSDLFDNGFGGGRIKSVHKIYYSILYLRPTLGMPRFLKSVASVFNKLFMVIIIKTNIFNHNNFMSNSIICMLRAFC